jgi:hypothetical protein
LKGGIKTPEGKAVSRLNACKHSIFTAGLNSEDAESLGAIEEEFVAHLKPVGRLEEVLVEKLALTYLRMYRCAQAEAHYNIPASAPQANSFGQDKFVRMVGLYDLYDARLTNQFLKLLHEIERLQRLRAGEEVPPPIVADVNVQTDTGSGLDAAAAIPAEPSGPEVDRSQPPSVQEDSGQKAI